MLLVDLVRGESGTVEKLIDPHTHFEGLGHHHSGDHFGRHGRRHGKIHGRHRGHLAELHQHGPQKLAEMFGIVPGVEIEVLSSAFRGPVFVLVNGSELRIPRFFSRLIDVKLPPVRSLSQFREGDTVRITQLPQKTALKQRLLELGFRKGAQLLIVQYAPLQDPVKVSFENNSISLRVEEAAEIMAELDEIVV